jgi:hypothetical protein
VTNKVAKVGYTAYAYAHQLETCPRNSPPETHFFSPHICAQNCTRAPVRHPATNARGCTHGSPRTHFIASEPAPCELGKDLFFLFQGHRRSESEVHSPHSRRERDRMCHVPFHGVCLSFTPRNPPLHPARCPL